MEFVRWVNASQVLGRIPGPLGPHLTVRVQGAGRLDCELRERDAWYGDIEARHRDPAVDYALADYLHLSQLWVLDVFELVRTIDSAVRRRRFDVPSAAVDQLRQLKSHLAQIRTPLAKFEPSGRPGVTLVGYPVLVAGVGAGWHVGENSVIIVSRQTLADEFLTLLESAGEEPKPPGVALPGGS